MNSLNEYITIFSKCLGKKEVNYSCDRSDAKHGPLYMYPSDDADIMIISESPSETASTSRTLNGKDNPTYYNDILRIIFNNVEVPIDDLECEFNNKFYWTHYCKCYPGKASEKGSLNGICARNYLKKEIELFNPKFIMTFGAPAAKFLFNIGRRKSMSPLVNRINLYKIEKDRQVNVVCITHFSGINTSKEKLFYQESCKMMREQLVEFGIKYVKP